MPKDKPFLKRSMFGAVIACFFFMQFLVDKDANRLHSTLRRTDARVNRPLPYAKCSKVVEGDWTYSHEEQLLALNCKHSSEESKRW